MVKRRPSTSMIPSAFKRPSVTVDLMLMSVDDDAPAALLMRRGAYPDRGRWALPGDFVAVDEDLDAAARRVLAGKTHLADAWIKQLHTFGAPGRDSCTRIISVAYFALLPAERFAKALPLAFDHADMLGLAVKRLRGRLGYSQIASALLPERFTLRALQDVHKAMLGRNFNKTAFRRRLLASGWLEATGGARHGHVVSAARTLPLPRPH